MLPSFVQSAGPVLLHIIGWVVDALPDISNLILVLVGVIMSLPKLAERIEDQPVARYAGAVGCILLGLCGFVISVNQRREATSQMGTLLTNMNTLVSNTNTEVNNTNTLVTTFGLLMPQINALNARTADLDKKIDAAKRNPQAIASLQAQVAAAREQSRKISNQLLLAMVPGISNELDGVSDRWNAEKIQLLSRNVSSGKDPMVVLAARWLVQARPSIVTADSLRERLLEELPPSDQTPEDTSEAAVFARAIKGELVVSPDDLKMAAKYLRELSNRVAAITNSH
jgi:hypothetical protein